jgi:competence protein ComEA
MDAANPLPQPPAPPAQPSPAVAPAKVRTWPHAVQWSLFVIAISAMVGLLTHSILHGSVQRPAPNSGEPPLTRLDLNLATRAELRLLPGVGEKLAERIEAYRILNGPYRSIDELRKVPGIGPLTVERLRPWLVIIAPSVEAKDAMVAARGVSMPMEKPARSSKKEDSLTEPIDVNTASASELQKLPGIGPKLSQRIVDTREKNLFKTVDDLRRVPGIGPKTLAKIRPYIVAGQSAVAAR